MTTVLSHARRMTRFLCILLLAIQTSAVASNFGIAPTDLIWKRLLFADDQGKLSPSLVQTDFYLTTGTTAAEEMRALAKQQSPELVCRYPARYAHMANIGVIPSPVDTSHCIELHKKLEDLLVDDVWLVIASPSVKSPMSYFGHVALVFRRQNDLYFSRAISFLADSDGHDSDLSLMLRGATGAIPGKYTVNSFHQLINKYVEVDQRAVTAYQLVIAPEELDLLARHLVEVDGVLIDYNFFTNNCSTGIRTLLEVALGEITGTDLFGRYTSPNMLVAALQETQRLDKVFLFEPTEKTIYDEYWALTPKQRLDVRAMLQGDTPSKIRKATGNEQSARALWIVQNTYRLQFKAYGKPPDDYAAVMAVDLDWGPEPYQKTEVKSAPHRYFAVGFDFGRSNDPVFSLSPGLYDKQVPSQTGKVRQTFRYLTADFRMLNSNLQVDELRILDLEFLSQRNMFSKPRSWQFQFGVKRSDPAESLGTFASYRLGNSWGSPNDLISVMGGVDVMEHYISPSLTASYERSWGRTSIASGYSHYVSEPLNERMSGLNLRITNEVKKDMAVTFDFDSASSTSILSLRVGF